MNKVNYKKILEDNKDNTELLSDIVREVNSYDGSLDGYEVYEFNDEFFDMMFEGKPIEASRATFFGNIQSWSDEWIRFDGYGNLESMSEYQRADELQKGADEIIDRALEVIDDGNIDIDYLLRNQDIEVK